MEDQETRLARVEELSRNNSARLDHLEDKQEELGKLVASVEVLALRQGAVESDVKEIKQDVRALTAKPGQRWEATVDKVVWAVLAALLGFLLAQLGL